MKTHTLALALLLCPALASAGDAFGPKPGFSLKDMLAKITSFFSASSPQREQEALPAHLPPDKAEEYLRKEKPVLVDVRTPEEFAAGHLAGASLVDFKAADFAEKIAKLDKSAKTLIYCRSGHRSGLALERMAGLGFADAKDIAGGISAWQAAGYPVVK